jgi:hypothetical protein
MDPCNWWYYFTKLDGNKAGCNYCDWTRDRGPAKPTNILKNHLKNTHKDIYQQKLNAELARSEKEKKEKEAREKQKNFFKPTTSKNNDEEGPTSSKQIKLDVSNTPLFPIFGMHYILEFCHNFIYIYLGSWRDGGECSDRLKQLIMEKICVDMDSFSTVEKSGFERILKFLVPDFNIGFYFYAY